MSGGIQVVRFELRASLDAPLYDHVRGLTRPPTAYGVEGAPAEPEPPGDEATREVRDAYRTARLAWREERLKELHAAGLIVDLGGIGLEAAREKIVEHRPAKGTRGRRAKPILDVMIAGPHAHGDPEEMRPERRKRWARETLQWLQERVGPDMVLVTASAHFDETAPHVQALFVPIHDGKLAWKAVRDAAAQRIRDERAPEPGRKSRGFRDAYRTLQDDYHAQVGVHYGLARGEVGSEATHAQIDRAKAARGELRTAREAWQRESEAAEQAVREAADREAAAAKQAVAAELRELMADGGVDLATDREREVRKAVAADLEKRRALAAELAHLREAAAREKSATDEQRAARDVLVREIVALDAKLADKRGELGDLDERDRVVGVREGAAATREGQLEARAREVEAREGAVHEHESRLAAREVDVAERETQVTAEREAMAADLEKRRALAAELAELRDEAAREKSATDEQRAARDVLVREIVALDAKLADKRGELGDLDERAAKLDERDRAVALVRTRMRQVAGLGARAVRALGRHLQHIGAELAAREAKVAARDDALTDAIGVHWARQQAFDREQRKQRERSEELEGREARVEAFERGRAELEAAAELTRAAAVKEFERETESVFLRERNEAAAHEAEQRRQTAERAAREAEARRDFHVPGFLNALVAGLSLRHGIELPESVLAAVQRSAETGSARPVLDVLAEKEPETRAGPSTRRDSFAHARDVDVGGLGPEEDGVRGVAGPFGGAHDVRP